MTPLWQFVKRLGGHVRARYRKIKRWFKGGKPAEGDPKTVAVFLAGAFTLVATALAVIGLGEGDIDRAVVNERWWSLLGFGAIVIAVCHGSLMSLAPTVRLRGLCGAAGVVVLGKGLETLATAAVDGRIAKDLATDRSARRTPIRRDARKRRGDGPRASLLMSTNSFESSGTVPAIGSPRRTSAIGGGMKRPRRATETTRRSRRRRAELTRQALRLRAAAARTTPPRRARRLLRAAGANSCIARVAALHPMARSTWTLIRR